jgi:hypothetical protein
LESVGQATARAGGGTPANVVSEFAGMPALERLRREIAALSPEEQRSPLAGSLPGS